MGLAFKAGLVQRVLQRKEFIKTGVYETLTPPYHYAVIDPRRHNISVWVKANDQIFDATNDRRYRNAGDSRTTWFCTNGPPMEPPHFTGEGLFSGAGLIVAGFAAATASNNPWEPYDAVRSGNAVLHAGRGNVKWFFTRTGQGTFGCYTIGPGSASGDESLSGCYGIVANSAVVNSADHNGLKAKEGCTAWARRPLDPLPTPDWQSEVSWLPESRNPDGSLKPLDGVIIGVGMGVRPVDLANRLVDVGCTEAVAMDGSDSVVCGHGGGALKQNCPFNKDLVQRWGLYCT